MNSPKISVIVPIYNVQQYLEECLDSLRQQTFRELEIIMVNDGSTDKSGDIMHRYAAEFDGFYAYDKPNGGLGQARNFGVQYAHGEYIAFVDSDDIVHPEAYEKMYDLARRTNSDMVIGNVMRFNSSKHYPSVLHQKVFSKLKLRAHITRDYELIYDTTAWNKLYRTSFWEKNHFKFPEGMLYEDIPVTIPAHYLANSVDVLDDVVYYWRARDLGDQSITQNRTDLKNLTDRLKAVNMLNRFFEAHKIEGELKEAKDFKILNTDLLVYLNKLTEADEPFIDKYLQEVSKYLQTVADSSINQLWPIDRMKYYFVKLKDKQKVLQLLEFQKSGDIKKRKLIKKQGHYYVDYPFKKDVPISYTVVDDNLQVLRRTLRAAWEDQTLTIKGYCFINKIDVRHRSDVDIQFSLVNEETDEFIPVKNVQLKKRRNNTYRFGIAANNPFRPLKRIYNYDWSEFNFSINFDEPPFRDIDFGCYYVQGTLTVGGITRTFRVGSPIKGKLSRAGYSTKETTLYYMKYNGAWDLNIYKQQLNNYLNHIETKDGFIQLTGKISHHAGSISLLLRNNKTGLKKLFPLRMESAPSQFVCLIPAEVFKDMNNYGWWNVFIVREEGDQKHQDPIYIAKNKNFEKVDTGFAELQAAAGLHGQLLLAVREYGAELLDAVFQENTVQFFMVPPINWKNMMDGDRDTRLFILSRDQSERFYIPLEFINNREKPGRPIIKATIKLGEDKNHFVHDQFDFKLLYGERDGVGSACYQIYTDKMSRLSYSTSFRKKKYKFYQTHHRTLALRITALWGWIDRGPLRREALRKIFYPLVRLLPMKKKTVIFESYWGKNYECNPRALYEYIDKNYPEYETVWSVRNPLTHIDGNAVKIRIDSFKYYYYMARAKYFVNNVNFPDFYRKRKGAVELQTMHGTPLKTLGLDVPGEIKPGANMKKYLEKNGRWDYLSVPSDYVAGIAKRAFAHHAQVLNSGYPRNDKLFFDNTVEKIHEIKRKIGIPLNKKVIFYAPTWRVKNKFRMEINIQRLKEYLSNDYILLVKFHHYVAKAVDIDEDEASGFVYNETSYDDIRDLYLISDVLITDYSSVMFDYAILNRPIVLFPYDLEQYRDNLRGMYFDIIEEAPGPICLTNDELVDALTHLDQYWNEYGNKLEYFRKKYNQYDKGNACKKIFDTMFIS